MKKPSAEETIIYHHKQWVTTTSKIEVFLSGAFQVQLFSGIALGQREEIHGWVKERGNTLIRKKLEMETLLPVVRGSLNKALKNKSLPISRIGSYIVIIYIYILFNINRHATLVIF